MAEYFGVVTFDDRGPISNWSRLAEVNSHNMRLKSEGHCNPDGPGPVVLEGGRDLVRSVKERLSQHGIDPGKLRKNGAIAFEVILTASHRFFTDGPLQEQQRRAGAWVAAACAFARKTWSESQIVSMVLHMDEYTPHIHVILMPLVKKVLSRWPERGSTWRLVGREISGPGKYQRVHDEYARAMAPLGLRRGVARSGRKYRPYSAELADLEEAKVKAAEATAAAERAGEEARAEGTRMAAAWLSEFNLQQARKADLDAREALVREEEARVKRQQAALRQAWHDVNVGRQEVARAVAAAEGERMDAGIDRMEAAEERRIVEGALDALMPTLEQAMAFRRGLLTLPLEALPRQAVDVLRTIGDFEREAELPANDGDELPANLQQRFAKLGRGGSR